MKAHLVDGERAASTYAYPNEKQQSKLEEAKPTAEKAIAP